jgi:hypothetical protein
MNVRWTPLQLTSPKHWYLHHINLPIVNDLRIGSPNNNVKSFWNKETTTELEKAKAHNPTWISFSMCKATRLNYNKHASKAIPIRRQE